MGQIHVWSIIILLGLASLTGCEDEGWPAQQLAALKAECAQATPTDPETAMLERAVCECTFDKLRYRLPWKRYQRWREQHRSTGSSEDTVATETVARVATECVDEAAYRLKQGR